MRSVLFLINGFGVESKESYSVYDETIMPNFDKLSKKYMFSKLSSNVFSTIDGFRNMSLERNDLYNYSIYERDSVSGKIAANPTVTTINNALLKQSSKLHIMCFVDTSMQIVENLKHFIMLINKEKDKKIFLHIVLTGQSYQDYPMILDVLSKMNIELEGYASIGMVMGIANILNSAPVTELNFLLRNMISELGERWTSFKQKLDVSYGTKVSPNQVKQFVVNNGFGISSNDIFLLWNYDNINLTNFIDGVKSINYGEKTPNAISFYSLFPVTYKEKIPSILNFEIAERSLASNMKGLGFKSLIMCARGDVNSINYYLNGLQMVNNPNISFVCLEDKKYDAATVVNTINAYPHELVVINYDITSAKTIEELKEMLTKIDAVLGAIYDNTAKNSYSIIISSLFGMNKMLENVQSGEKCNIIYNKVPIIFVDNFITKKDNILNDGSISDIFKTCYKAISKDYNGECLIDKKNILYRLVFK